ncbi:WD40-like Beta Propeller Repeat [Aphelenchoides besseyi]|nr:WD40-like Beta Propeller Repeat [Aphelenchoides besseyi]
MKCLVFLLLLGLVVTTSSRIHDPSEVRLRNVIEKSIGQTNRYFSPNGRFLAYSHKRSAKRSFQPSLQTSEHAVINPRLRFCFQIYLLDLEEPTKRPQLLSNRFGTYESAVFLQNSVDLVAVSDVHSFGELNNKIWKETCFLLGNSTSKTRNFDFHQLSVGRDKVPYRLTWNLPEESSVEVAAVKDQLVFIQIDGTGKRSLCKMRANATEKGNVSIHSDSRLIVVVARCVRLRCYALVFLGWLGNCGLRSSGTVSLHFEQPEVSVFSESKNQLFTLSLSSPKPRVLPIHNLNVSSPSFHSKENVKVLFTGIFNQSRNVFVFNRETETVKQITFLGNNSVGILSPDGKKFVWSSSRNSTLNGQSNLFIADFIEYPPSEQTMWQKILNSLVTY